MKFLFYYPFCWLLLCFILLTSTVSTQLHAQVITLASPNKKLLLTFSLRGKALQKELHYTLSYQGQPVITPSRLGFLLKQAPDFWSQVQAKDTLYSSHNAIWKPVYGERSQVQDQYNQVVLTCQYGADTSKVVQVVARAYDVGIAFQYHIPEQAHFQIIDVDAEQTHFSFPAGTKAYFTPSAQTEYELLPLNAWKDESERPLTLVLPDGLFACIAEAQMVNYARTKLALADNEVNTLVTSIASPVTETSPFSTPWRVIMVAEKPGQLIENNDIILNLNPSCAIASTSWIKPGKVIREVTLSTAGAKACVDFAVQQGLQYIHFDAGWYGHEYEVASDASTVTVDPRRNPKGDLDLPEAIRYAKEKGIGVLLYVNHRALEKQLDTLFPLYKSWGCERS
jgi:alpha-glucosidase